VGITCANNLQTNPTKSLRPDVFTKGDWFLPLKFGIALDLLSVDLFGNTGRCSDATKSSDSYSLLVSSRDEGIKDEKRLG
jgi:hypothetical protein